MSSNRPGGIGLSPRGVLTAVGTAAAGAGLTFLVVGGPTDAAGPQAPPTRVPPAVTHTDGMDAPQASILPSPDDAAVPRTAEPETSAPGTTAGAHAPSSETTRPSAPPPAPSPADVTAYTVQPGDTLWSIAFDRCTTDGDVRTANDLSSNDIQAGQELWVAHSAHDKRVEEMMHLLANGGSDDVSALLQSQFPDYEVTRDPNSEFGWKLTAIGDTSLAFEVNGACMSLRSGNNGVAVRHELPDAASLSLEDLSAGVRTLDTRYQESVEAERDK